MILLSFTLSFIGFITLSLTMKRHYRQLWPAPAEYSKKSFLQRKTLLRITGYSLLISAALICFNSEGIAIGLTIWAGVLTIAALSQVLLLTYYPQWVMRLGLAALVVGIVKGVIS